MLENVCPAGRIQLPSSGVDLLHAPCLHGWRNLLIYGQLYCFENARKFCLLLESVLSPTLIYTRLQDTSLSSSP